MNDFLKNLVDWQRLGLELGLLYPTLEKIDEEQRGNITKCMIKMIGAWLKRQDIVTKKGIPSWSVLKKALQKIGENQLASELD